MFDRVSVERAVHRESISTCIYTGFTWIGTATTDA